MAQVIDYYKILGVNRDASAQEIKIAYRKLARKYHPDISKEHKAEKHFKEIQEAYAILKDPEKREAYDHPPVQTEFQSHNSDFAQGHGSPFTQDADFFESLFRGGGRAKHDFSAKGEDFHSKISISLEDAYNGITKEVQFRSYDGDNHEPKLQTLNVTIPTGVRDGQHIRLCGQGGVGHGNGERGDLYLKIHVLKHRLFEVIEDDVFLTVPVTPWEVALGTTIQVPTLSGKIDLKIPSNSQGGQKLRIKGKGLSGMTLGDQYIILKIVTPPATTAAATDFYKEMASKMPFNPREKMGV